MGQNRVQNQNPPQSAAMWQKCPYNVTEWTKPPHHSNRIQLAREILKRVPSIQCLCWPPPSALSAHLLLTEYLLCFYPRIIPLGIPLPLVIYSFRERSHAIHIWNGLFKDSLVERVVVSKTLRRYGPEKAGGLQSWALLSSAIFW